MIEVEPTMRYRPDHVHGATESEQKPTYFYKVMEGDDVDDCLKDGWFESPDFPIKKKPGRKPANKQEE